MDDDLLDEILDEVEALGSQLPEQMIAPLCEERAQGLAPGAPGRAAWLSHAGERWEMQGDLERARSCYEQAAQDGGEAYLDPRAQLVGVLLELGDDARAEVLLEDIRRDLKAGWQGRFVHEIVGEALELHGRLVEAQRWFTMGLTAAEREEPGSLDLGCLNGRWRVRRLLDLPRDRYDERCEERRREYDADVEDEKRLLRAATGGTSPPHVVLYWPEPDLARLLDRWPGLAETFGVGHDEHRTRVEHRLHELSGHDGPLAVGVASFDEYVRFVTDRGDRADDASSRSMYGAHLAYAGRCLPWPPGEEDACWCGSGRRYRECCGQLAS